MYIVEISFTANYMLHFLNAIVTILLYYNIDNPNLLRNCIITTVYK